MPTTKPPQAGYNPSVGGLNLNFNRVHFEWARQADDYRVTMDARSERFRPEVRLARMQIANRASPVYTFQMARGLEEWSVARGALGNSGSRWLPVRQPDIYAGEAFQALAAVQGLALPAPQRAGVPPQGQILAEHRSDTLADVFARNAAVFHQSDRRGGGPARNCGPRHHADQPVGLWPRDE